MDTNTIQNTAPASSQATQQSGNSLMNQMSSGPAGILYTLSNELTSIYNQLEASYNEMTKAEAKVEQSTIDTASTAQVAAATKQAYGIVSEAVGAGIGAVMTIGGFVAKYSGTGGLNDLNNKVEAQNSTLKKLGEIKSLKAPPREITIGDNAKKEQEINARAENMKKGIFTQQGDEKLTPKQLQQERQSAVNKMSEGDYNAMIKDNDKNISDADKALNKLYTQMQYKEQNIDQIINLGNSGVTAGSKGANAAFTYQAGEAQATQQVASGVTQMATSTGEATRQNIAANYNKVSEAINSASQGAKAYAQT